MFPCSIISFTHMISHFPAAAITTHTSTTAVVIFVLKWGTFKWNYYTNQLSLYSLFRNKKFVLKEIIQQNPSKFDIFLQLYFFLTSEECVYIQYYIGKSGVKVWSLIFYFICSSILYQVLLKLFFLFPSSFFNIEYPEPLMETKKFIMLYHNNLKESILLHLLSCITMDITTLLLLHIMLLPILLQQQQQIQDIHQGLQLPK